MAEEPKIDEAAPQAAAPLPPAVVEGGEASEQDKKPQRNRPNVAELFDLSKPIPKVEKPLKEKHDAELMQFEEKIELLKKKRVDIQNTIESTLEANKKSGASNERDTLNELRMKKGILINEKKGIREKLNAMKGQADKLMAESKSSRQNVKFTKVEDIDNEIKRLQRKQETTSMSLQEEKRLIKELDLLKSSKKAVAGLKEKEGAIANTKEQRTLISAQLKEKDTEIDAVQAQIDEKQEIVNSLSKKDTTNRDELTKLFTERDEVRDEISKLIKVKGDLRTEFRKKNDDFYNYQRAVKAQRQIQWEEAKKKEEEDKAAFLKKQEEEELKKIPYEEEQMLCDYLANYLNSTYLSDGKAEAESEKKDDTVAVTDDPFANFKPVSKKNDDVFLQMGGKRKGKKKKPVEKKVATKFTLNMDSFEQFGLIGLVPPTSLEEVPKAVEALKEKKEWYSKQPRGSVPTAKDIRKANEAEALKVKKVAPSAKASNGKGKFDLSTDEFAPLGDKVGAAAAGPLTSSWGAAKEGEAVSDEAPTPAEATDDAAAAAEGA